MKKVILYTVFMLTLLFLMASKCYAPNLYDDEDEYFKSIIEKQIIEIKKAKLLSVTDNDLIIYIKKMATKYEVDFYLVLAVIKIESCGIKNAVSKCGAIGLMQIMPILGKDYGYTREELFNPYINIYIGVRQLSYLIHKYKSTRLALMCYLCGESFVYKNFNRAQAVSVDYINKINSYLGGNYDNL